MNPHPGKKVWVILVRFAKISPSYWAVLGCTGPYWAFFNLLTNWLTYITTCCSCFRSQKLRNKYGSLICNWNIETCLSTKLFDIMLSDAVWPVRVRVRVGVSSLNGVIMGLLIVHYKFILNRTDGAIFLIVFNNESRHARWILAEAERWEDSTAPDTVSCQLGSLALCTELKWCNIESRHFELEI